MVVPFSGSIFLLLLSATCTVAAFGSPVYVVIVPRTVRYNVDLNVFVAVTDSDGPKNVTTYLQSYSRKREIYSTSTVEVSPDIPTSTTLRLDSGQLPDSVASSVYVQFVAEAENFVKKEKLLVRADTGFLLIQTDKPIYTPRQTVKIRIIPLDESLKIARWPVKIQIKNPQNIVQHEEHKIWNGTFIREEFQLASYPVFGTNWTVTASFTDGLETSTSTKFEVNEFVLPEFEVKLHLPPYLLQRHTNIAGSVEARYTYGKNVAGGVILSFWIKGRSWKFWSYKMKLKLSKNGLTPFSFSKNESKLTNLSRNEYLGKYLMVEAKVKDFHSRKMEKVREKFTVLVNTPYVIEFKRCKKYFHSRYNVTYDVMIDVYDVKGNPVAYLPLFVNAKAVYTKEHKEIQSLLPRGIKYMTDQFGQKTVRVQLMDHIKHLIITVNTNDGKLYPSEQAKNEFTAKAYNNLGSNYITIRSNGKAMKERSVLDVEVISGGMSSVQNIFYLVLSRGKILSFDVMKNPKNLMNIQTRLTTNYSPGGRILVFYINRLLDNSAHLVTDSLGFEMNSTCDCELSLDGTTMTDRKIRGTVKPGEDMKLSVYGEPGMNVGLLAVDKAVYLLNQQNLLKQEKVMKMLNQRDQSDLKRDWPNFAGMKGGKPSVMSVFKDCGVLVLSNAVNVKYNKRGKRETTRITKRKNKYLLRRLNLCCEWGYKLKTKKIATCYQAQQRLSGANFPDQCIEEFSRCCEVSATRSATAPIESVLLSSHFTALSGHGASDVIRINTGNNNNADSVDDHISQCSHCLQEDNIPLRSDFPESWLFQDFEFGTNKSLLNRTVHLPDTITNWTITAVGIPADEGVCFSPSLNIPVFKDFFLKLDVPAKVVRLEQTHIQVTIYNYRDDHLNCTLEMKVGEEICASQGQTSGIVLIQVGPNDIAIQKFPITPLLVGTLNIEVIAGSSKLEQTDRVLGELHVISEGMEKTKSYVVRLDPVNQMLLQNSELNISKEITDDYNTTVLEQISRIHVDMPDTAIPRTAQCDISITRDPFTKILDVFQKDIDVTIFDLPTGCGEQTISKIAPLVFVMNYLQSIGSADYDMQVAGIKRINFGYMNCLQYLKNDGSYAVFPDHPSSVWLSAFAAKTLSQAKRIVNSIDEERAICPALMWVVNHQHKDGSFEEMYNLWDSSVAGKSGSSKIVLTAFVLTALVECDCQRPNVTEYIEKSQKYIESKLVSINDTYTLAIATYALLLTNSEHLYAINDVLRERATETNTGLKYWNADDSYTGAVTRESIEATSYALLVQLELSDIGYSNPVIEWLSHQQTEMGAFISTQDTVIALQAMTVYEMKTYDHKLRALSCEISSSTMKHKILLDTSTELQTYWIRQINIDEPIIIRAEGGGHANVRLDCHYKESFIDDTKCTADFYAISSHVSPEDHICDVCGENCHSEEEICTEENYEELCEPDAATIPARPAARSRSRSRIQLSYNTYKITNFHVPKKTERKILSSNNSLHITEKLVPRKIVDQKLSASPEAVPLKAARIGYFMRKKTESKTKPNIRRIRSVSQSISQFCLEICIKPRTSAGTGMSNVNVQLLTGYKVSEDDLIRVKSLHGKFISRYELFKDHIMIYINGLTESSEFCFKLVLKQERKVSNLQPAMVEFFVYYNNSENRCRRFYHQVDGAETLQVSSSRGMQKCVERKCSHCLHNVTKTIYANRGSQYLREQLRKWIHKQICLKGQSAVVLVKILQSEDTGQFIKHKADILKVAKQGKHILSEKTSVNLLRGKRCPCPLIRQNETYLVFGNLTFQSGYFLDNQVHVLEYHNVTEQHLELRSDHDFRRNMGHVLKSVIDCKFSDYKHCSRCFPGVDDPFRIFPY